MAPKVIRFGVQDAVELSVDLRRTVMAPKVTRLKEVLGVDALELDVLGGLDALGGLDELGDLSILSVPRRTQFRCNDVDLGASPELECCAPGSALASWNPRGGLAIAAWVPTSWGLGGKVAVVAGTSAIPLGRSNEDSTK